MPGHMFGFHFETHLFMLSIGAATLQVRSVEFGELEMALRADALSTLTPTHLFDVSFRQTS